MLTKKFSTAITGAAFLMATSAIGPGFLTQTAVFTNQLAASFGFVILISILLDIGAQLNIWSVLVAYGKKAQDVANEVLPGMGLAALAACGLVMAWWSRGRAPQSRAAMALSLLHEVVPLERHRPWRMLIGIKLALFAGTAAIRPDFVVVIMDYGLTMLAWTAAAVVLRRPWRSWMLLAIALSIVAALVQQLHLAPSTAFNHNDLYHVIQAVGLWGFYRAGLDFSNEPAPGSHAGITPC